MRKPILMVVLVVVAFACSEPAGQMLVDGGQMIMDAGNAIQDGAVPDAGAQQSAQCDQMQTANRDGGYRIEYRYAVVSVGNPHNVKVQTCQPSGYFESFPPNVRCSVYEGATFDGNNIYIGCGYKHFGPEGQLLVEVPDPVSITVYE